MIKPAVLRDRLKAILGGVRGVDNLTLKSFRAGMATEMVKRGMPLRHVLEWGQWRSRAVLCDLDEDKMDGEAFVHTSLDASDAEDAQD